MKSRTSRGNNYTNPCLTMHQPWASLLVHGIKRVEGRSWPSPIRGRLWIHAASKVPDLETIKAMEDFYREIYAVDGVSDLEFPQHYPVSKLLGCVEVVGCLGREELAGWEMVSEGVRLEALTDFCWVCEQPQKLLIPFEMRGYQGVYNLERKMYESAHRGLTPVKSPLQVKFPIPDPRDWFSLKPGSIGMHFPKSNGSKVNTSSNLDVAIAGARAAATQFSKKDQNSQAGQTSSTPSGMKTRHMTSRLVQEDEGDTSSNLDAAIVGTRTRKDQNSQAGQTSSTSSAMKTRQTTASLVKEDEGDMSSNIDASMVRARAAASHFSRKDQNSQADQTSSTPNAVKTSQSTARIVKEDEKDTSSNLDVSIAGARAAATQFSKKDQNSQAGQTRSTPSSTKTRQMMPRLVEEDEKVSSGGTVEGPSSSDLTPARDEKRSQDVDEKSNGVTRSPRPNSRPRSSEATSKIFAAALRGIKQS